MRSRIIINFILFALLLILAGFIFLNPTQELNPSLTSINKNTVAKIIIHRESDNVVFIKTDNHWMMTAPYTMAAHEFRIQSLLNLLDKETSKYYDINSIDPDTYGLQPPRAHIQFNDTHIYFGKANPVNGMRYIQVNDKLHLLYDDLYPLIRSQPTSFVDLSLLPADTKIKQLTLPELHLNHSAKGWTATSGNTTSADQIQTLLQNWRYAKAFAVHTLMERKSLGQITIELEPSQTIQFKITDISPWLILARTDLNIEYHIDESQKDHLLNIETPLADKL